ncbi:ribonuclease III [Cloacibacillus sp. An23]|uniref:ribonuclease III n=1 Tax=Cloacibacillus sp. An23 TaxID=1965591 RepID=UPI000B3A9FB2|nr:ribonuclease III [Cloacibacillus sp. An23]OUO95016.1 ribonuclease III [Cloacibacillus sp. An23]
MKNDKRREEELRAFQLKLGYEFKDAALLTEALTHSSYANENGSSYNERLEFLGDAVLELFTSERLFSAYPDFSEGEMTRLRARLVCKNSLNDWASANGLKPLIRLGKSIKTPTGSMAADCVEAVFGAVFRDGGYEAARGVVSRFLDTKEEAAAPVMEKDPKTELQELLQGSGESAPVYKLLERRGPEHASSFKVGLTAGGGLSAEAWGPSIKEAEFAAAKIALEKLRRRQG